MLDKRMKTFRELIAWELEQDRKQQRPTSAEGTGADKLTATMVRKLRYLNSTGSSSGKVSPPSYGSAA